MKSQGALFEQKILTFDNLAHAVFWTKGELFCKNLLEVSPQIVISEYTKSGRAKLIFSRFTQKQLQIHDEAKK